MQAPARLVGRLWAWICPAERWDVTLTVRASPSSVEAAGLITSALPMGTHGGDKSEAVMSVPFPKQAMLR